MPPMCCGGQDRDDSDGLDVGKIHNPPTKTAKCYVSGDDGVSIFDYDRCGSPTEDKACLGNVYENGSKIGEFIKNFKKLF